MAKNFGKILLGLTAAGAAGAGAYYWLKNRHNEEPEDEFDDSFEEDDFELDDDLGEVPERGYTTLTPTSAKEEASEEPVETKPGRKFIFLTGSFITIPLFWKSKRTLQRNDSVKYQMFFRRIMRIHAEISLTYKLEAFICFCICKV